MSRATPDDQLKFLLNCVKHSNNGKIDFVEVAKECGIVSKGAAAKRYERLMKANGIHPNGGPSEKPATPPASREKSKDTQTTVAPRKKRKVEGAGVNFIIDNNIGVPKIPKSENIISEYVQQELLMIEPKSHTLGLAPSSTSPTAVHLQLKPQPASPFQISHLAYPLQRSYRNTAPQYLQSLITPSPSSSPKTHEYRLSAEQYSSPHLQLHKPDENLIFENFCIPELFEERTFLEVPEAQCSTPIPPSPQDVMKKVSFEEKPTDVVRSGKRPSEGIFVID